MDVMRPPLLWIDGRCYRQNIVRRVDNEDYDGQTNNDVNEGFSCGLEDDICEVDESLITSIGDRFMTEIEIPSVLCGWVVGRSGLVKKQVESETRTRITIPGRDEEGKTKIVGRCKNDVISARNRIEILMNTARQKQRPTHFISIPLTSTEIKERFAQFTSDVLQTCGKERGVQRSLFQDSVKLHLTVGTMVLLNDNERQRATKVLKESGTKVIRRVLEGKRLLIEMSGIEYMNDDPSEVNVLYAKVSCVGDSTGVLQRLADQLVEGFVKEGLMERQYESVKLHATLMNTTFARDSQLQTDSTTNRTFNASKIIEKFRDFRFGVCEVPAIHLSQFHSKGDDGYYKDTFKVSIS